ncbi:hypothetical protein GXW75_24775, partial [Roseomonas oryzicola]|nr:hypothetical protein [Neoroseomonas oryzicola]
MTRFNRFLLAILCVLVVASAVRLAAQTVPVEAPEPEPAETTAPATVAPPPAPAP